MSKLQDPVDAPLAQQPAPGNRASVIAARNRVVGLLLGFLALLFFAITIVKIKI